MDFLLDANMPRSASSVEAVILAWTAGIQCHGR